MLKNRSGSSVPLPASMPASNSLPLRSQYAMEAIAQKRDLNHRNARDFPAISRCSYFPYNCSCSTATVVPCRQPATAGILQASVSDGSVAQKEELLKSHFCEVANQNCAVVSHSSMMITLVCLLIVIFGLIYILMRNIRK